MAREAGAKKVYFASAAPPIRHPNVYGIDMPAPTELIAYNRDVTEIRDAIGADYLVYQDLEDLHLAGTAGNEDLQIFEDSVFSGTYVTGDIDETYLAAVEAARSDDVKNIDEAPDEV